MAENDLALDRPGDPALAESLSPREREMLVLAMNGLTDQGIAHKLGISIATVSTYWGRVRIKFGPLPRPELVARFVQSEMARSSAALAASEARFRALLDASSAGVLLTDPDGKVVYANAAYERLAERSLSELMERGTSELIHPEDRERVAQAWRRCLEEGTPYTSEHRYLRPDGTILWVHTRGDAWRQDGEIGGRVSVVEDVTAAHAAEQARVETERRYRNLLALAPEAILSVDESLRIVEFNAGAERTFGYVAEEILGEPLTTLLPEASRNVHEGYVRAFGAGTTVAARPMAARAEVRGRRKDGEEFPCEASIIKETVDGTTLYTAILRDVSSRSVL